MFASTKNKIIIACLFLLSAVPAMAADKGFFKDSAVRLGVAGGQFRLQYDPTDFNETSGAWNVFAGYQFNNYLAVEGGWIGGAKPTLEDSGFADELSIHGWHASVLGSWPLGEVMSVYARGGVLGWGATEKLKLNDVTFASGKDDGNDPYYGVGLAAEIETALVRLEYTRSKVAKADATLISLAVVWRIPL